MHVTLETWLQIFELYLLPRKNRLKNGFFYCIVEASFSIFSFLILESLKMSNKFEFNAPQFINFLSLDDPEADSFFGRYCFTGSDWMGIYLKQAFIVFYPA